MSKPSEKDQHREARRNFAKTLAVVAATPFVSRAAPAESGQPVSARALALQTKAPEKHSPTAEALGEAVRYQYGKYLDEDQLDKVKGSIDRGLRSAERLKQFKLKNSDEPAFTFSADLPSAK